MELAKFYRIPNWTMGDHGYRLVQGVYLMNNFEDKKRVNEKIKPFLYKLEKVAHNFYVSGPIPWESKD